MLPSLVSETSTSRKGTLVGECELVNFMVELGLGSPDFQSNHKNVIDVS